MENHWYEEFNKSCAINHQKSVESVKKEAATEMSLRLLESLVLKNTNKGNWNSSAFKQLCNATQRKEADGSVVKENWEGGNDSPKFIEGRKDFKLHDSHTVGGRNRLAELVIDKLQSYYISEKAIVVN